MRQVLLILSMILFAVQAKAHTVPFIQTGTASFYSHFEDGRKTASGERYNPHAFTAASRTLPIGSIIQVTNVNNGSSVIVRINDRGPFCRAKSRILDISYDAAQDLGMMHSGVAHVKVTRLPDNYLDHRSYKVVRK